MFSFLRLVLVVALAAPFGAQALDVETVRSDAKLLRALRETAATVEAIRMPFRATTDRRGAPDPITVRLPGTRLAMTGGSAWLRRTSESPNRPRGFYVSLQLTY